MTTENALQRRLISFLSDVQVPRSFNGAANMGIGTSVGAIRERNQDCAVIVLASQSTNAHRKIALGVVCDGIGGLLRGGEAALWAVSTFVSRFLQSPTLKTPDRLRNSAAAANSAVYELLRGRGGTTLSAVAVDTYGSVTGVNVGDSRIYGITSARRLIQLSQDDTLGAVLGKREDQGHSNRLLQFVGMGEGIEPHLIPVDRKEFGSVLLTSDGVHGAPSAAFDLVVRNATGSRELVRRLIGLSEVLGGRDNSTVVIVPTQLESSGGDINDDVILSFISATDRFEVWLPNGVIEQRAVHPESTATDSSRLQERTAIRVRNKARRVMRDRSRLPSANVASVQSDANVPMPEPERPALDIRFPDKSES
jgi:serine/threonine protein phosphatase PrpC